MGFFQVESANKNKQKASLCNLFGCRICPAFVGDTFKSESRGALNPDIYVLSKYQDCYKEASFQLSPIFDSFLSEYSLRFGSVVRCGQDASGTIADCCKESLIADIEAAKPKVILGLGAEPLRSLMGLYFPTDWRGRKFPVTVGKHQCWFVPLTSPGWISSSLRKWQKENEHTDIFKKDICFVAELVDSCLLPKIEVKEDCFAGVELNYARTEKDIQTLQHSLDFFAQQRERLGLDIETTGLKPYYKDARILSCAVSTGTKTISFLVNHPRQSIEIQEKVSGILHDFLIHSPAKICHNLSFELQWFDYILDRDILFGTQWEDTMAQAYIIDQRQGHVKGQHPLSLDMLILLHFGFNLKAISSLDRSTLITAQLKDLLNYNALDAKYVCPLQDKQASLLETLNLQDCYRHQVDSARTLAITQNIGVHINWDRWLEVKTEFQHKLDTVLKTIEEMPCVMQYKSLNGILNLNADAQIVYILTKLLKVKLTKKTAKSGVYTVDEVVLKALAKNGVIFAKAILEYRYLRNMLSKYIDSIKGHTEHDGLLHTSYNNLLTKTGRLSSNDPNLQNFPKRKGKQLRSFIYA